MYKMQSTLPDIIAKDGHAFKIISWQVRHQLGLHRDTLETRVFQFVEAS
jgi:hypothetical protein